MSNINKSYINNLQGKTLEDKVNSEISGIDLNWQGYNRNNVEDDFIKSGTKAHVNRCLFWLASKEKDYVRDNLKGGILYDLLGELNQNTNLTSWEEVITNRFNSEFSSDLSLIMIKLEMDSTYRKLYLNMMVRDNLNGELFNVNTSVER